MERSDPEHLRILDRPLQQLLILHMYCAAAAAIPRGLFQPIYRCIVSLSEWLPTVDLSFTLLFGERNQPVTFLPQKLYKNELLEINAEYFQTPMGQLHARVINTTNAIYCHGFISYSRPPFMGFKRARLRLAVLNAYKGLPLIFYLLHKNRVQHGGPKKYFRILCS